ncbi:dimethyladenosine transferase 1, mitochondrial-like [Mya arenaria]|nr:dimethyladenosine transferase 1, mitochondrial-like [Mya arenaria]XP_052775026.1 dimethyladenosine transferase 1, mitochondrial-like [Mya arenaria]XP_052775028.1 dimethyladenosine transferase 1, mitochondrial-like [Mya arenaria]
MRLPPLPTLQDIIRMYKLSAAQKLSQNFILDMTLNHKIVKLAGRLQGCQVCEVGPGPGGITRAILEAGVEHLYVIEKDRRFFPGLKMLADATGCLTAHQGDILRFSMENLFPEDFVKQWEDSPPNIHIIGNLPFNVATPLIFKYMESICDRTDAWRYGRVPLTLTFQKEVAERMVANPNDEQRCRMSVDVQNQCEVTLKKVIPGRAFVPPPDVDVGLVHFVPRTAPLINLPYRLVTKVTRTVFHHRQKMIKNNLVKLFPSDQKELVDEMLKHADIDPERRPVTVKNMEFARLCHAYNSICTRLPYILQYDHRNNTSVRQYEAIRHLEKELCSQLTNVSESKDNEEYIDSVITNCAEKPDSYPSKQLKDTRNK